MAEASSSGWDPLVGSMPEPAASRLGEARYQVGVDAPERAAATQERRPPPMADNAPVPTQQIGQTPAPPAGDLFPALAGQLDRLRRAHEAADVPGLRGEVRGLVHTVAGLAEEVAGLVAAGAGGEEPPPSWLWRSDPEGQRLTAEEAAVLLRRLTIWAGRVYLRFPDAELPECWLWHPDVVEELVWLWTAWRSAYLGSAASVQRAGDWHDRQRPGVVRRIRSTAGSCSLREHVDQPRERPVPTAEATAAIAAWWADPSAPAPVPTSEQIRTADAIHHATARSWQ